VAALLELATGIGIRMACRVFGIPRATVYRLKKPPSKKEFKARQVCGDPLSAGERAIILGHLHSERFVDSSPVTVYHTLLDFDGIRLCSVRTMYRLLQKEGENNDRRHPGRRGKALKPELVAEGPNQLWSWDITQLRGPTRGVWFYLYVVLDVFSRRVVGWTLAFGESGELAKELIHQACLQEGIERGKLTLHSDRGAPMKSQNVVGLLSWLGVEKSLGRPSISNDNPYSESAFKTLKYCPAFPERFHSFEDAMAFLRGFFLHYNTRHFHSGICYLTPDAAHFGQAEQILEKRHQVELAFYHLHPERFPRGAPKLKILPKSVWINKPSGAEWSPKGSP